MMPLALAVTLLGAKALSQTVSVKDLPESEVRLIAPGTPEFASELPGILSPWMARAGGNISMRMVDPLLPFSAIVVNRSGRAIRSLTLRWASVDPAGRPSIGLHGEGSRDVVFGHKRKPLAMPGGSILFTPAQPESLPEMERRFGSTGIERMVQGYRSSKEVVISIDGILFDDGRFVGSGESEMGKEIEGQYAAVREIQSVALPRLERGESAGAVLQWLRSQTGSSIRPRPNAPVAAWQHYWKTVIARDAAALQTRKGDAAAIDRIRSMIDGRSSEK